MHARSFFEDATQLQRAVAHGRLMDARDLAGLFATRTMTPAPGSEMYAAELREAARQIADAADVTTAGAQLGRLGGACGACHAAVGVTHLISFPPAPTDQEGLQAQMKRHEWAARRLWEGVIGPSEAAWRAGAEAMATSRLDVALTAHEKPNETVVGYAEQLRVQAVQAGALTEPGLRSRFYGEMMTTCAGCHSIVRQRPIVGAQ